MHDASPAVSQQSTETESTVAGVPGTVERKAQRSGRNCHIDVSRPWGVGRRSGMQVSRGFEQGRRKRVRAVTALKSVPEPENRKAKKLKEKKAASSDSDPHRRLEA